ncbi:methionyl-tRNA formyltransferase [Lichenicola cladoniae]|uniref:Methionyl-tRNA formyltransferase n=1 Tax=Lichenicola cladoniae TaxID=1484109 RepID=A0A6M8HPW1_9PROT|nr:methionyl-tRNA formyltransferase [Lichenicola cladoniae]NPD66440.1 methionyl-tRNA formyltransferase [Acetobacteraceae bacterium]QKE90327.1 methionyl-tRNA formyltransferase [Lichenicola cladoniae]
MRLAFMGTPDFAVPALRALHEAGHEIVAVYSQQPRPAGRGQAVRASPVQREAERLGLMVRTPARLKRNETAHAEFAALSLDAAVVAAYGLILPATMLTAPVRGCLNIHASLLPRWRGAAPIQASILAGDGETGITIMQMDEGLDTGPMLRRDVVPIDAGTTASGLHDALATMGARLILETLEHDDTPVSQPAEGTSYAPRLTRTDGRIDWRRDAASIDRQVRAMTPWPGAFTALDGVVLKIEAATPMAAHPHGDKIPGTVLDDHLTIACGSGALRIDRLQAPGRSVLDTAAFLRGRRMPPGTVLQ